MRQALLALPLLVIAVLAGGCDGNAKMTGTEQEEVILLFSELLREQYLFPEIADEYIRTLEARLAEGAYDHLTARVDFAEAVTADLKAVARPVTEAGERREILEVIQPIMLRTSEWARGHTLQDWLDDSPLVEVTFPEP